MESSSIQVLSATIANGQQLSDEVDCGLNRVARLSIPASGFTGASLTVWVPDTADGTYRQLFNSDGSAYTIVVAAGTEVIFPPADVLGVQKFKLQSASAEAAERVIGVVVAP